MNGFKFTPGPWYVSDPKHIGKWAGFGTAGGRCRGVYATGDELEMVANVPKDYLLMYEQEYEANALLISMAPEMFEALYGLAYMFQPKTDDEKLALGRAIVVIEKMKEGAR